VSRYSDDSTGPISPSRGPDRDLERRWELIAVASKQLVVECPYGQHASRPRDLTITQFHQNASYAFRYRTASGSPFGGGVSAEVNVCTRPRYRYGATGGNCSPQAKRLRERQRQWQLNCSLRSCSRMLSSLPLCSEFRREGACQYGHCGREAMTLLSGSTTALKPKPVVHASYICLARLCVT
jgi:hypothetical protein